MILTSKAFVVKDVVKKIQGGKEVPEMMGKPG
jgi:hypothetical protein